MDDDDYSLPEQTVTYNTWIQFQSPLNIALKQSHHEIAELGLSSLGGTSLVSPFEGSSLRDMEPIFSSDLL